MYSYLYDLSLSDRKYDRQLARIEGRLTDLQISGKITRLTVLRNLVLGRWLEEEVKKGIKTVVAVGSDDIFHRLIEVCLPFDIVLGYIPLGEKSDIASLLNIPKGQDACDILSRRKIKKIDLGKVNDHYFITSLVAFLKEGTTLVCDKNWKISTLKEGVLTIYNMGIVSLPLGKSHRADSEDGKLEGVFKTKRRGLLSPLAKSDQSIFFVKNILLQGKEPFKLNYDIESMNTREALIEVMPKAIRVIVGSGGGV